MGAAESEPFSFRKFPFMLELYADMFPDVVIQKGLQVGASEYAVLKALHANDQLGCDVMYGFPHSKQIGRFSKTRIKRIISRSPHLSSITEDAKDTRQTTHLRVVRGRYFYLVGVASDSEIQSESVDFVVRDEFDLMDQDNSELLRKRNYASMKRMYLDLGFPLLDGAGINAQFLESDQREYEVFCPSCGTWQEVQWPRNVDRKRLERVCFKCAGSLEGSLRNYRFGRWTPRNPALSNVRHGYHVSRLLYPDLDFADFLKNADNQVRAMEFNVFDLGLPYTQANMQIREPLFMSCVDTAARIEDARLHRPALYGGADVGSVIHVWMEVSSDKGGGRHSRLIDLRTFSGENKFQQLEEYLEFAQPVAFGIDLNPETTEVMRLVRKFPMMVWGVAFDDFTNKPQDESSIDYETSVVRVNRTFLLDCNISDFLNKALTIPGEALSRHKDLKAHFAAPVQIMDTVGRTGVPIKRWVTPKGRPDHWTFARAACLAAEKLEGWIRRDGGRDSPPPADDPVPYSRLFRQIYRRR